MHVTIEGLKWNEIKQIVQSTLLTEHRQIVNQPAKADVFQVTTGKTSVLVG